MTLHVNGEVRTFDGDSLTVIAILKALGLADRRVAVECNRKIVPRAEHGSHLVQDGDHIEIVQFVGGG
jgi:sulfur carrier protein